MTTTRIKELLSEEDIEGLLALGAPGDEYEAEAEMIGVQLKAVRPKASERVSPEKVAQVIRSVWQGQFELAQEDLAKRDAAFMRVARRICSSQ